VILLDTVLLSELRKRRPNERVVTWMRGLRESEVFVSVISIGEIERGIAKADDAAFAATLDSWLAQLLRLYADRILPVSTEVARRWGRLSAELGHDGADVLIAATAACHGLTVAARNTRHFRASGVPLIDPFASS
jgi:predicted nucleic acid-binding protein